MTQTLHDPVSKTQRANARKMRKDMTDAELKLWNELRAHRLMGLGFRRQMPIGSYIVDFACVQHKLVIEVDGSGHGQESQRDHDGKRTAYLSANGWTVLRFWNDEVLRNMDDVCTRIIAHLREKGVEFR